jgi:hypothetical protein
MAEAEAPDWTQYSGLEKVLHRIAFATPGMPRIFGQLDQDIFAPKVLPEIAGPPVFVTGLPRAGTTLLLELLAASGVFASFTYRHMPFVLAPCMWRRLTGRFRREGQAVERSHGDGMQISFDSPEAFEEVLWLAFHKKDYVRPDHLIPIDRLTADPELPAFLTDVARRLMAADGLGPRRYLSKNNANIGRLETVTQMFPQGRMLICLRDPVAHARSLQRQHQRFLNIHARDPFAARYMRWIGHFDFGAEFRPIRFGAALDPGAPDFWLRYWTEAYGYALEHLGPGRSVFCYEQLLEKPRVVLERLAEELELPDAARFVAEAEQVRSAPPAPEPPAPEDAAATREARALYAELVRHAL